MEHFEDIVWRRSRYNGRRDYLIHGLVVAWVARIMDESGAAAVDVWNRSVSEMDEVRVLFTYLQIGRSYEFPFDGQCLVEF